MLYGTLASPGKPGIFQNVARNIGLACRHHIPHEPLIAPVSAPAYWRAHRLIISETGVRGEVDRAHDIARGIPHPRHLVAARLDHDAAHILQHLGFIGGVDQHVIALRHHAPGARHALELHFCALALRYVFDNLDQVGIMTPGPVSERDGAIDPDQRAVLA